MQTVSAKKVRARVLTFAKLLPEEGIAPSLAVEVNTVADETQADTSGGYCPHCLWHHDSKTTEISDENTQNNHMPNNPTMTNTP